MPPKQRMKPHPAKANRKVESRKANDKMAPRGIRARRQKVVGVESTRDRILAAATAEFAARGYDGARVDEIVRHCKISKNLLYYYFGSKERLFIESLEAAYAAIQSRQAAVPLSGLSPIDGVRKLIAEMFRHLAEVPEFIGLLNSENLHKAVHLQKSNHVCGAYPPMVLKLNELLEQGKVTGDFRSDATAIDLYIAISGMSYHALSNQYTLSVLFDRDFTEPSQVAWRIEHITDIILSYLRFKPNEKSNDRGHQNRGRRSQQVAKVDLS